MDRLIRKKFTIGIDGARILAAILVVAIHTYPFADINGNLDFFVCRVLGRLAVPFFLMTSGYFVLRKSFDSGKPDIVFKFLKKIALIYAAASAIYAPLQIYSGNLKPQLSSILKAIFFEGTFYHLWYFPALITGVAIVYFCVKIMGKKNSFLLFAILYIIGLFGDSYYGCVSGIEFVKQFYAKIFNVSSFTRNGIFMAPLFLALGAFHRDFGKNCVKAAFFTALMSAEAFALKILGSPRHDSMYAFLPIAAYFVFGALLEKNSKSSLTLRRTSLYIYLIHPMVILFVRMTAKLTHSSKYFVDMNSIHFLAVAGISFVVSYAVGSALHKGGKAEDDDRFDRAWIEIDTSKLIENVRYLKSVLPRGSSLMPTLKADAYGHGAVEIAKILNGEGIFKFCVATLNEALSLRNAGVKGEILILGYTPAARADLLKKHNITQTAVDLEHAAQLSEAGLGVKVHVAIDTGMHRIGEKSESLSRVEEMFGLEGINITGTYTHLSAADSDDGKMVDFSENQLVKFHRLISILRDKGYHTGEIHTHASNGLFNYGDVSSDVYRLGISLFGLSHSRGDYFRFRPMIKPIISVKARIIHIQEIDKGESVGYGLAFTAKKSMRIATISIGYGDGLRRELSDSEYEVSVNGKTAKFVGRICMDFSVIDISEIEARVGDVAVVAGDFKKEGNGLYEMSEISSTVTAEVLSGFSPRLERIYM